MREVKVYNLGKYNEAIKASIITIRLSKQFASSWFEEYNKLNKLYKYDEAIEAYDKGLELNNKCTLGLAIIGDAICNLALWHPEGFKNSLRAYDDAIRLDPLNIRAWCGKCIALNALGIDNEARAAYTRAYRLTILTEHPCKYVEDFEKPIYWP
jgi:tetratricopeptide (TPR) repeat protein